MENRHSSAAPPNNKGGSGLSDCPENKVVAMPNLSSEAVVAATVATSNDDVSKAGKSVPADDKELKPPHIVAEGNRDYFGELQALMPQISENNDTETIVGHAIHYIKSLQKTNTMLEKRMQELELAQQAVAEATASSSSAPPPPLTTQDMALAAMSSDVPDACSVAPPLQPTMPVLAPAQRRIITARQVGFQTWTWPNLVLSVSNDTSYINVYAPRQRGMWTKMMVLLALNNYGIEVVTGQMDSDAVHSVFNVHARVITVGGENPSTALEVFQLAVSEILMWLTTG